MTKARLLTEEKVFLNNMKFEAAKMRLLGKLADINDRLSNPKAKLNDKELRGKYNVVINDDKSDNSLFPDGKTVTVVMIYDDPHRVRRTLTALLKYSPSNPFLWLQWSQVFVSE